MVEHGGRCRACPLEHSRTNALVDVDVRVVNCHVAKPGVTDVGDRQLTQGPWADLDRMLPESQPQQVRFQCQADVPLD